MRHSHEKEILTRDDGMPIDFTPNANRIVRVAPDSWRKMLNHTVRGFAALGDELKSTDPNTVYCYNINDPEGGRVAEVSDFRAPRKVKMGSKAVEATVAKTRVQPILASDPRFEAHTELAQGDS